MNVGELTAAEAAGAVRRNLLLLAAGMAAIYGMVELAAGAATLTFEEVGGSEELAGSAAALFLLASALGALPAGRAMDRYGRRPVLVAGFAFGIAGSLSAALGAFADLLPAVLIGFLLAGFAIGTVGLSRTAAVDMHPPDERPRAVALVLFGAVFGALLGPLVFIPLINSSEEGGTSLGLAWVGAAGFTTAGLVIASRLRPDPQQIARALGYEEGAGAPPALLREIVARPGVVPALVATLASWGAMASMMTLSGSALVEHGGHSETAVFPVIAAHFVGMFGLFPIVGQLIERYGRSAAMISGLLLLAASTLSLAASVEGVVLAAISLFGIGLGWSLCFVAATAQLSEAASPSERGMLLGLSDLLGLGTAAGLAVLGGIGLATTGLTAVCLGAGGFAAIAAAWILVAGRGSAPAPA